MTISILHCHSTFDLGGKEARAVRLMNAFGARARHTILSGVPGALGARSSIDPAIRVRFPDDHPPLSGRPTLPRFKQLADYMRDFDLILTYNWGAMDAVVAHRLYTKFMPPLIHHEDGFNADEVAKLRTDRNLYRRIGLSSAKALVVPSKRLETIALKNWKQPRARVHRIANGVDTALYEQPATVRIAGLNKTASDVVVGTLAGLRPVKNLRRLVRAIAQVPGVKLVIVGEGPDRDAIAEEASQLGISSRVIMPGFMAKPHEFMGHFDIFALSSDSEQMPISVIEAMATGLPIASTDVGDVRAMVSDENSPFIVPDEHGLAEALRTLAGDLPRRKSVGLSNRMKAKNIFDEQVMIASYASLYSGVLVKPHSLLEK